MEMVVECIVVAVAGAAQVAARVARVAAALVFVVDTGELVGFLVADQSGLPMRAHQAHLWMLL